MSKFTSMLWKARSPYLPDVSSVSSRFRCSCLARFSWVQFTVQIIISYTSLLCLKAFFANLTLHGATSRYKIFIAIGAFSVSVVRLALYLVHTNVFVFLFFLKKLHSNNGNENCQTCPHCQSVFFGNIAFRLHFSTILLSSYMGNFVLHYVFSNHIQWNWNLGILAETNEWILCIGFASSRWKNSNEWKKHISA